MADRKYEFPELAFPVGHWINRVGGELRLSGILFQSHNNSILSYLPDARLLKIPHIEENPSPEEWSEILRRSDDPLVFERDETGTIKAWIRKAQYTISGEVQQRVWVRDGLKCMYCGKSMGEVLLTIDHFLPLELGGRNDPSNFLSCCRRENKRKGNQHPADFCQAEGLDYQFFLDYLEEKSQKP